jgi:hypothetical protein
MIGKEERIEETKKIANKNGMTTTRLNFIGWIRLSVTVLTKEFSARGYFWCEVLRGARAFSDPRCENISFFVAD